MNKKVFVVRGNHDGMLGVYTQKKLAYACADTYLSGEVCDSYTTPPKPVSYAKFCKELSGPYQNVTLCNQDEDMFVEVICMPVNHAL